MLTATTGVRTSETSPDPAPLSPRLPPPPQPPRSRFARAVKEARGGLALTERDEALLADLFLHQVMDRSQIQELYFGSVPRANARLRQLFDHGYVSRHFRDAAPYGAQALYRATPRAAGVIARRLEHRDVDAAAVKRTLRAAADSPEFLEHTLAIVDFYLAIRAAVTETRGVRIETWLPELMARHEYQVRATPGGPWREQVFKPDAFVRLEVQEPEGATEATTSTSARPGCRGPGRRRLLSYFLEVDRGHTSSGLFARKLAFHRQYRDTGLFAQTYGTFETQGTFEMQETQETQAAREDYTGGGDFRTLVVTTGRRRLEHLIEVVEAEASDLFWFTTFADLDTSGPLGPVWRVPFAPGYRSLWDGAGASAPPGPATARVHGEPEEGEGG